MAINPLAAALPTAPLIDADGNLVPVWRGFFLALQARTGGGAGVSAGDASARITAETANRIAADNALGAALAAETAALEAAIAAEQTARINADTDFASAGAATGGAVNDEVTARQIGDARCRGFAFFLGAG